MTETSEESDNESPAATEKPADPHTPTTLPKIRSHGPTSHDWEQYRSIIIDLYVEQDMRLSDVMKHMEDDYGFTASARMYKTRFLNWHVQKNLKSRDMEALIQVAREKSHEKPDLSIDGKIVPFSKIQRYVRRSGRTMQEVGLDHPWTPLVVQPSANTVSEDSLPSRYDNADLGLLPMRSPSPMSGGNTRVPSSKPSPIVRTEISPEASTNIRNEEMAQTNDPHKEITLQQTPPFESNASSTSTGLTGRPSDFPSPPKLSYQSPGRLNTQTDILRHAILLAILISTSMRFQYFRLEDFIDANLDSTSGDSFDTNDLTTMVDLLAFLQLTQEVIFLAVIYFFIFNASPTPDKRTNFWMQLIVALKFSQAILDDIPYSPVIWIAALHGVGINAAGLLDFELEILCDMKIDLLPRPGDIQTIRRIDGLANSLLVWFDQGDLRPTTARWRFQYDRETFAIHRREHDKLVNDLAMSEIRHTTLERAHDAANEEIRRLDVENCLLKDQIQALRSHVEKLSLSDDNLVPTTTDKSKYENQHVERDQDEMQVAIEPQL